MVLQLHVTYHWDSNYPAKNCTYRDSSVGGQVRVAEWDTQFHEYAVEYDRHSISFFLDGVLVSNSSNAHPPTPVQYADVPFFLILNTAVGGPWPQPVNSSTHFPTHHVVDYVRVSARS